METPLPPVTFAPDGLYESDIDALIAEFPAAFAQADAKAQPTSRLVDGSAEHRRRRRIARQTVNVALRTARQAPFVPDDQEAA